MTTQLRIIIEGQLHGLNFRLQCEASAQQYNLYGFVRTLADGRIEIEAQGDKKELQQFLDWCTEEPHASSITNIMYRYDQPTRDYTEFTVRR